MDRVSNYMHLFTLYSHIRPFGCSVIFSSYGPDGPALFMVDPSGVAWVSPSQPGSVASSGFGGWVSPSQWASGFAVEWVVSITGVLGGSLWTSWLFLWALTVSGVCAVNGVSTNPMEDSRLVNTAVLR